MAGLELPTSKIETLEYPADLMNKPYKDHKMPEISAKVIENQSKQRKKWEAKIQKQMKQKPIKKRERKENAKCNFRTIY